MFNDLEVNTMLFIILHIIIRYDPDVVFFRCNRQDSSSSSRKVQLQKSEDKRTALVAVM